MDTTELVPVELTENAVSQPETREETVEFEEEDWRQEQLQVLLQPNYFMRIIGKLGEYYIVALILFVTMPLTYLFVSSHLSSVYSGISSFGLTALIEGNAAIWTVLLKHQTQNAARTLIAFLMCGIAVVVVLVICYDEMAPAVKLPTILGDYALLIVYLDIACMLTFGFLYHLCDNKAIARWVYIQQKGVAPGELTGVSDAVSSVSQIVSNQSLSRVSTVSKETAELVVKKLLQENIHMSLGQLHKATGIARSSISKTRAWKHAMLEREKQQ